MCGHFALNYINLINLMKRYGVSADPDFDFESLLNEQGFYPSRGQSQSNVPVVMEQNKKRVLELFRWDMIPSWWKKPLSEKKFATYNARKESLAEKTSFRNAWKKNQRCIIPATEFFEWPDKKIMPPGMPRKEHKITVIDQQILSLAGIWDECKVNGHSLRSCTIITIPPNDIIANIPHTRMPAILSPQQEGSWLDQTIDSNEVYEFLEPYPAEKMKIFN
ncbi:MAG: SOS response-associated peptidase [bacterium]